MKQYPLHITNQLNETWSVKSRVRMIFQKSSAQIKAWKYTGVLVVAFASICIMACQKQPLNVAPVSVLIDEHYNPSVKAIEHVNAMAFSENSKEWYFEVKKPQTAGFLLSDDIGKFVDFQLFNGDSQLLASNETGETPAKGFTYKFNKTGTYYIKVNDLGKQERLLIAGIFFKNKETK
ncbi:hypothetical protein BKI52_38530 [marine bacterium AO1-C]|nr:hypothetical protein BKI52_38530 [marine bacterium AO1-C]